MTTRLARRVTGVVRLASVRYHVLLVVVAVVLLPLLWVWSSGTFEAGDELYQQGVLHEAAAEVGEAVVRGSSIEPAAVRFRLRVRVLWPDGRVEQDVDQSDDRSPWMAEPFFGPGGPPRLTAADAHAPPLVTRPEVVQSALAPVERCDLAEEGRILVCSAARRLPDGRIVHVMRGSPRLVRSLYEERWSLTAITLVVGVIGLGLAVWLNWRIVDPIEELRNQVVARMEGRLSTDPVTLGSVRTDEIGELARAFNQLLGLLDDRNRANTAFAADLAHELKNPAAAVRAAVEALGADRPLEGERLQRLRRVLGDASHRMEVVVHQFLELARAEAGLPGAVREPLDAMELCLRLSEATRSDERHAHLVVEVSGEEARVEAVPERLETAVRNLLSNAAGFARSKVSVGVHRVGGEVEIRVSDDGPGLEDPHPERLFTRYRSTREGGTGLGLPMTRAIVLAHGGELEVESAPGSGATFRIRLPAA